MTICYLCIGSTYLEDAERHESIGSALDAYRAYVDELNRFGCTPGPRGGVRKERC